MSTRQTLALAIIAGLALGGIIMAASLASQPRICTKWGEPRKVTICEGDSRIRTVCREALEGVCLEYNHGAKQ